jgi:soluble lytic murein transglycosylase
MKTGFFALEKNRDRAAAAYFAAAVSKAPERENADRALFWAWKSGGGKSYLWRLSKSYDINIYTLAACDALDKPYPKAITPSLPKRHIKNFDIKDPIAWSYLKRKIFSPRTDLNRLAKNFIADETVGYYSYIKNKASLDKEQYFPMPYRDLIEKLPKSRQAILYAIARQESRFIPTSISSAYAMGIMQIMPFLSKAIAKQLKGLKWKIENLYLELW